MIIQSPAERDSSARGYYRYRLSPRVRRPCTFRYFIGPRAGSKYNAIVRLISPRRRCLQRGYILSGASGSSRAQSRLVLALADSPRNPAGSSRIKRSNLRALAVKAYTYIRLQSSLRIDVARKKTSTRYLFYENEILHYKR